jgi:hypothetical protein
MEQLGESSFELRLVRGHHCVSSELFDAPDELFDRSEELKRIYMPPPHRAH